MRPTECAWERAILRTIAEGRWPEHCEEDLREHLAACGTCAVLIEVAHALARDRERAARTAPVPGSGAAWWRMQLRMRREAERSARRTVTLVQGAILGVCAIVALVLVGEIATPPEGGAAAIVHTVPWSNRIFIALVAWLFGILAVVRFALPGDAAGPLTAGSAQGASRPLRPALRGKSSSPPRSPDRTTSASTERP